MKFDNFRVKAHNTFFYDELQTDVSVLCYHGNQGYSLKEVTKTDSDVMVKISDFPKLCLVLHGNAGSCSARSDLIGTITILPLISLSLFRMVTLP